MIAPCLAALCVLARHGRQNRDAIVELAGPLCGGFMYGCTIYGVLGGVRARLGDRREAARLEEGEKGWPAGTGSPPEGRRELWRASQRAAPTPRTCGKWAST